MATVRFQHLLTFSIYQQALVSYEKHIDYHNVASFGICSV
ncbi:hypothetical protein M917_2645 [Psychrobacter aquaticus CMS 56]|uniref:Uncharacterized protein n=1 Tax=Psychrobacter aquaticus CMS 56 TaxID=1354303 RepID=U4T1C1_9GAMM|nr:hypothetical protein M917_2645 [Psychrobacter aquaticus CMS 56]